MVVSVYVFEVRGGAMLNEVFPQDVSWSAPLNDMDQISVTIDLNSTTEADRDWRNLGAEWKHAIAVDIDGRLYGGPILPHSLDDDSASLTLQVRGIRALLATRFILPPSALTAEGLTLPNGDPDPAFDTNLSGLDYGTIGKRWIQQAMLWPGWSDIPIVFHADRAGTRERNVPGVELKNLNDALSDLSGVFNGPDIRFSLRWADDAHFEWVYESGTEDQPQLRGPDVFALEVGLESSLSIETNPSQMGSVSWGVGGRADDTTLIRSMYTSRLVDLGYPLMELKSDASTNTVEGQTLDDWNAEKLRTADRPWEFWTFQVAIDGSPTIMELNVGDYVDVVISDGSEISGGYIPVGTYRRRIVKLSGDMSDWVSVTCGEVYGDG